MSAEDNAPAADQADIGEALVAALGFEPAEGLKSGGSESGEGGAGNGAAASRAAKSTANRRSKKSRRKNRRSGPAGGASGSNGSTSSGVDTVSASAAGAVAAAAATTGSLDEKMADGVKSALDDIKSAAKPAVSDRSKIVVGGDEDLEDGWVSVDSSPSDDVGSSDVGSARDGDGSRRAAASSNDDTPDASSDAGGDTSVSVDEFLAEASSNDDTIMVSGPPLGEATPATVAEPEPTMPAVDSIDDVAAAADIDADSSGSAGAVGTALDPGGSDAKGSDFTGTDAKGSDPKGGDPKGGDSAGRDSNDDSGGADADVTQMVTAAAVASAAVSTAPDTIVTSVPPAAPATPAEVTPGMVVPSTPPVVEARQESPAAHPAHTGEVRRIETRDDEIQAARVEAETRAKIAGREVFQQGSLINLFRRSRRLQSRKVRRVVRHVDPWSVLTFSVLFHLCVFAALLLASVLVWNAAEAAGTIEDMEQLILDLGDYETFEIKGDVIFRAAVAIAGVLTLASSVLLVLLTVVFNLISDLVGGIRMTVIEEETVRVRRKQGEAAGAEPGG